ncbi:hypothetical protein ACIBSW_39915 [Actinoplanes sp. NPDC049668]|uniref:hypothetical protein n=1 Tax=unclassified Actinoplanes TaxID=2626549 RepID=UPI00339EE439
MTYPNQQPPASPRPGPPPGGFRPGPPPQHQAPAHRPEQTAHGYDDAQPVAGAERGEGGQGTGHPAVDAVLRSLANAATLAPADQIAEYEAAHQVLQETLASIDR